ncbi:hypothetical protein ASG87_01570 [Frateuria sp. Soil773]|nr:hypothetical protein ASG87_01570 [Frateuria sp. Soil773]
MLLALLICYGFLVYPLFTSVVLAISIVVGMSVWIRSGQRGAEAEAVTRMVEAGVAVVNAYELGREHEKSAKRQEQPIKSHTHAGPTP